MKEPSEKAINLAGILWFLLFVTAAGIAVSYKDYGTFYSFPLRAVGSLIILLIVVIVVLFIFYFTAALIQKVLDW